MHIWILQGVVSLEAFKVLSSRRVRMPTFTKTSEVSFYVSPRLLGVFLRDKVQLCFLGKHDFSQRRKRPNCITRTW
eukprot:snap_masked-scaffold_3-processed-gene-5.18-mRNA-1 protein AED:1.00 eAED:1.00 QI:0/0/0/0/1/1/2/0/75